MTFSVFSSLWALGDRAILALRGLKFNIKVVKIPLCQHCKTVNLLLCVAHVCACMCVFVQPPRALERAGQVQVPLVTHGQDTTRRGCSTAQQLRIILCSAGILERLCWTEVVKSHEE